MPRIPCLLIKDLSAAYHVIFRTALDGFVLGDAEKERPLSLLQRLSRVCFADFLPRSGNGRCARSERGRRLLGTATMRRTAYAEMDWMPVFMGVDGRGWQLASDETFSGRLSAVSLVL